MKKLLLTCALASACMLTASAYDYTGDKTEWMKHIPGTTYASQVTIPGSHDSATGEGWATGSSSGDLFSKTQNVTIDAQLAAGLRGFDIRPNYTGGKWVCAHGMHTTKLSLEDCFGKFTTFLTEHPSEFIVIHLYHGGSDNWSDDDKQRFPTFLANYSDYLVNFRRDLTVDDLRGKILIFSREEYDGSTYGAKLGSLRYEFGWGSWVDWDRATNIIARGNVVSPLNEGRVFYQDLAGFEDIEVKKAEITKLLEVTTSYQANTGETCIWFFNFGSGYTGNISTSASYKSTATACNPEFISYLANKPGPAGIVLADYVCVEETQGTALIDALINNNFNYLTYVEDGVGAPTVFNPSTSAGTASSWALGQGSTNFRATQRSASIIGDFNGDGLLDIMQSGSNDHAHLYLNGDWNTVELQNQEQGIPQNTFPHFCTLDFNNDGLLDVIIAGVSDHYANYDYRGTPYAQMSTGRYAMTCLYQNMGNNTFKMISNSGLPVMVGTRYGEEDLGFTALPTVFGAGDFDHDGYTDVVVCGKKVENGSESEHAAVYHNNGNGTFTKVKDLDPVIGYVHVADMNNDGWLDIVLTGNYNGSNGRVYLNNNGTSWTDATNYTIPGYWTRNNGSALGDFNKDGYLDLFTVGYSDQAGFATLLNYNNHGTSGDIFTAPYVFNDHGLDWSWVEGLRVAVRDFNADGNLDILYDMKQDGGVWYGSESMKFTREGYDTNIGARGGGIDDSASSFGDLNGDGLTDRHQTGFLWIDNHIGPQRHNGWEGGNWNWDGSYYVNTNSAASVKTPDAPTNVFITQNGNELNITWKDLDDKTLAYNVVFYNATDGTVISTLPVSIIKSEDKTDVKLAIGEGKEAAVRPGVQTYSITLPAASETEFAAGVQALSLYTESYSPIAWGKAPLPPLTLAGDANDNGEVTVADVVTTANYIAGKDVDNFHFNNANVVLAEDGEDEVIDVADITATVDLVYEAAKGRMGAKRHAKVATDDRLVSDNFKVTGSEPLTIDVKLENTTDYAAIQAEIRLPEGMILQDVVKGVRAADHSMVYNMTEDGTLKVVIYSLSNASFANTEGSLFSLVVKAREDCGDIDMMGIRASDASHNTYDLGFKGGINLTGTTGIETIGETTEAQYFTLQGVRVDRPERGGIYIRIVNGKSTKVVIR